MDETIFATKGNLMSAKATLTLSQQGYDLLDQKRNILIREMMGLIEKAKDIQKHIEDSFRTAYAALERANIVLGIYNVEDFAHAVNIEESISIKYHSVMGVEIPDISFEHRSDTPAFGLYSTSSALDEAYINFNRVRELTIKLAEVENSVYRLAININKTQKRANALKNVTIPKYLEITTYIQNVLEEKDREEFSRLKVIKRRAKD